MRYYGKLPIVLLSELATEKSDSSNCRIAAYLLANLDRADQIGIEQLAQACYVSTSTISRFCREIGLDSFIELRDLLRSEGRMFTLYGAGQDARQQSRLFAGRVTESLQLALDTLDYAALDALAADLHAAERISIFGLLKAETAAMNLQSDLVMLGKPAVTKVAFREQMVHLASARRGETVLIFSYTGVYFDYGLPQKILHGADRPNLWFITGDPGAAERFPGARVLAFSSKQDFASHPYQLQLVASLIAQRFAAISPDAR